MNNKPIKFAIVGFGNIGPRHATHILETNGGELAYICDVDEKKYDNRYKEYGVRFTSNMQEILVDNTVDVVNICVPNYLHKELTVKALYAGKHVLCEKPMAMTSHECQDMIDAADQAKKLLFIVKQNRYNPPVVTVKDLLDQRSLGSIFQVNVNCFWNRNDQYFTQSTWKGSKTKDGGCLFTPFSHFVDILYHFFGEIEHINGIVNNYAHSGLSEFEDNGIFNMVSKSGILISFNFSTCTYNSNMEGSITIIAEKGSLKIGGQYLNTIEYQKVAGNDIKVIEKSKPGNDYGYYKGSMSNHDKVIQNVVDTIRGRDEISTVGEEGKKVVEIIERMYASANQMNSL